MTLPEIMPARTPDVEVAEFDDEFVVFDPRCSEVHHLIGLAAVIFDACDGVTPSRQLVNELVELLQIEATRAEELVNESITGLEDVGALANSSSPRPPP